MDVIQYVTHMDTVIWENTEYWYGYADNIFDPNE